MNFFKIAYRDISSIFKNRIVRVSVAAIVIVPLLYSLLYLDAFWDPYSKLDKMPVAVVNLDKGGVNDGKSVNYGLDLANRLDDDKRIGFEVVSLEKAQKGLKKKSGTGYYSMFVVPEDFTASVLKAKDGKPKVAQIKYVSNDKKNFLASQINSKVILEIKSEVTKTIAEEDTQVVFDKLYEVKDGMKKAADGSKKLYDGLVTAKDGSEKLADGLNTLNKNVPQLSDGVNKLNDGSGKLASGLYDARGGVAKLFDGASMLDSGLAQLKANVPTLSTGVVKLSEGSQTLNAGLASANKGLVDKLLPGSEALANGMDKLSAGLSGAAAGTTKLSEAAGTLASGSTALTEGAAKLVQGQASFAAGISKQDGLSNASAAISAAAQKLKDGADKIKPGMTQLASGSQALKAGSAQVAAGVDELVDKMSATQTALGTSTEKYLMAYIAQNPAAKADPNMQKFLAALNTMSSQANDKTSVAKIAALKSGAHQVEAGAASLQTGINTLDAGVSTFGDSAVMLAAGTVKYSAGADAIAKGAQAYASAADSFSKGTTQFAGGASQFSAGAVAMGTGLKDAVSGAKVLSDGAKELNNGLKGDLATGIAALSSGAGQLSKGLSDLQTNMPALADGINKLADGASLLKTNIASDAERNAINVAKSDNDSTSTSKSGNTTLLGGMNTLYSGSKQLNNGLNELSSKVPELADGTKKLADGSNELNKGMIKLKDGASELMNKLQDGYNELKNGLVASAKEMGKYVAEPVKMAESAINAIKNYGTGFTPYFIPLSLWVGALMMFFVISDKVDADIKASSMSLVLGKFISYCYIGTIQAVLASAVVLLLGLRPTNLVYYFLFNILMSYAFIAIIQSLIFLMGDVGRMLSIILLILQLTSCAGTFPLEVLPKLFRTLYPYMPFTYCVSGLREIIAGIDYKVLTQDTIVLVGIIVAFLFISVCMKRHADKLKDVIEQKKLAA